MVAGMVGMTRAWESSVPLLSSNRRMDRLRGLLQVSGEASRSPDMGGCSLTVSARSLWSYETNLSCLVVTGFHSDTEC